MANQEKLNADKYPQIKEFIKYIPEKYRNEIYVEVSFANSKYLYIQIEKDIKLTFYVGDDENPFYGVKLHNNHDNISIPIYYEDMHKFKYFFKNIDIFIGLLEY